MFKANFPYIILLLIASAGNLLIAVHFLRRLLRAGSQQMALLMSATAIYSFGYAMELSSNQLQQMLFWSKIEYIGISFLPALWITVIIHYAGKEKWLNPINYALLYLIPVLTFFLHLTDKFHHLYYQTASMNLEAPFPLLNITPGPWYWVHTTFIHLCILISILLLVNMWAHERNAFKRQTGIVIAGSLVPWISFVIYQAGKSPWHLDLNPFAFSITSLVFAWGMFHYRLFDLVPVAREHIFESMRDGVIVLDDFKRLVDFNSSAQKIIKELTVKYIGMPLAEFLTNYPTLLQQVNTIPFEPCEFATDCNQAAKYFNVQFSPILNYKKVLIGYTVVFNDISSQKLLMNRLRILATVDGLTGALRREHFLEWSEKLLHEKYSQKKAISFAIMDLDHFKAINDTYGHQAGDETLKGISHICQQVLGPEDLFGRYGGEEFAFLFPGRDKHQAYAIIEELRKQIAENVISYEQQQIKVTASFGIADISAGEVSGPIISLENILKKADKALYSAKNSGRNCTVKA